jgi:type VI secretion system FHA domain protein
MPLHLATRRGPTGVAGEQREVTRLPFSIGRAPDNDWTLPDPGRVLSKRHCRITANGETWLITDTSSNGTFLNGNSLDPEVPRALRNGDRVAFGTYEIEATLGDGSQQEGEDVGSRAISLSEGGPRDEGLQGGDLHGDDPRDERLRDGDVGGDRLTSDPFSSLDGDLLEAARPSVGLPTDFDPLTPAEGVTESPYAAPDHVPELETNFRPPRPSLELLPEDWNQAPEPHPVSQVAPKEISAPPPLEGGGGGEESASANLRPTPPPSPLPQGEGEHSLAPPAAVATGDAAGFAAFVAGAGMAGASVADPGTTLAALGAAFRIVVSGLRRIMIARATIKGEFRIEQTMIRAAGNNPLKFSADDDDALAALLGTGRRGGMRPSQAIGEALRDMRRHELAVAAAMQQAVRDVLGELDPARIMHEQSPGMLHRLSGWSEQRAWRRYAARHAGMMRALANDFDSVFGRSFGRAYEAALAELAAQDVEADRP